MEGFLGLVESGCGLSKFQCSTRQGPCRLPLDLKGQERQSNPGPAGNPRPLR